MSGGGTATSEGARSYGVAWVEPGIILCTPPRDHDELSVRGYYASIETLLADHDAPYVCITDATAITAVPTAQQRRVHAELTNRMIDSERYDCTLNVLVIRSALIRGTLTALMWLFRNPVPTEVVGTVAEAVTMGRRALGRRSSYPPR